MTTKNKKTQKMKKSRVVLVGCGGISKNWLESPAARRANMVGFVDLNLDAAKLRATEFGCTGAVAGTDLEKVLKETRPDAVFDCSIPEAHCKVTLTALKQGCHVLGEKPMADSMVNARRMVAAAEKAGKTYAVIQNRRYLPDIIALKKFIQSGKIGKITTVQSNFFLGAHFGGFREVMDHVLLLDMAIHTFDAARFITGSDAERVYCHESNPSGSWYKHGAAAVAIFEMGGGIVYTYQGSWCSEGCNTSWEADWRIVGEKGSILWDGGSNFTVEVVKGNKGLTRPVRSLKISSRKPNPPTMQHSGVIKDFLSAIANGDEPQTVCTDNIKSLAMVHGAIHSANTGRRITL